MRIKINNIYKRISNNYFPDYSLLLRLFKREKIIRYYHILQKNEVLYLNKWKQYKLKIKIKYF